MTETRACPQCGAAAPPGIKFCGHCGFKMPEPPAPADPGAKSASPKRTMVGMPAVVGPGPGAEGEGGAPSAPSRSDEAFAPTPAEGVARPAELEGASESASGPARTPAAGRTMLGMPAVQT
ncbi:MAG: zinc-ribbon domain-containing protein, partial [Myxococcota bacterium]